MNIYNGNAGSGKSFKIKDDISKLKVNTDKILVISLNKNKTKVLSEILSNIKVVNWNEFTQEIFKKSPLNTNFEKISDYCAILIIHSIIKTEFQSNLAMKNLCKSSTFARELYNLFGLFKIYKFDSKVLSKLVREIGLDIEDKIRFQLVVNVYEKYNEILKSNNLKDFRDDILECINTIQSNNLFRQTLQNRYKYIFVSDAQNISQIQLELIKLIVDDDKLYIYGDNNALIKSFMGASAYSPTELTPNNKYRNKDILKRALFICSDYLEADTSNSIKYNLFFDFKEEMDYIAKDIIKDVQNGAQYSDFAILIRDNSIKQNIVDILNGYNIPINGQLYSESYQIFKYKFMQMLNLFSILEDLKLTSFEQNTFENMTIHSKVDFEFISEQLNLITGNILNEVIKDKYVIEKFSTLMLKHSDKLLIQTIYKNIDILSKEDAKSLFEIFTLTNELYQFYKDNNFVEIIVKLANIENNNDINYNKFIAQFLKQTLEITNLKKNILKEKIDIKTIFELQDLIIEDNSTTDNKVNIITFFKSAGLEFKKVYIPSLVENYFPKKTNYTHFISDNANKILSNELKKLNRDFDLIIPTFSKELKDEDHLLYVALTRAKEQVILSTHQFEGKKQVTASSFFETLKFADANNFQEYQSLEQVTTVVEENIENNVLCTQKPVIDKNDTFKLSASAIKGFLTCPQRFFYSNLLGIKSESIQSADYGTIVHAVLEVLLTNYISEFSFEKTLGLAQILFDAKNNLQLALDTGFTQDTIDTILKFSNLDLQEMYQNFLQAIYSLNKQGFFAIQPNQATCEIKFNFTLPEMPNISFKGFIDAIITDNLTTKLLDYKTGDKPSLNKLLSDEGVNFLDRNGTFSEKKLKQYEFQIPLYYLACLYSKQLEDYNGKVKEFGYQYIKTDKKGGCKTDLIDVEILKIYKDKIIENIKKYVVDEIYQKTEFEPKFDKFNCLNCPYIDICDVKIDETSTSED